MSSKFNGLREFGKFRLDAGTKVLWCENKPVNLPLKEIEMLCVLTEKGGEVISKEELLNQIWADSHVEESNLSRNIYGLRKMFKKFGVEDELIQTVPRRGYRFTGEVREIVGGELVIEKRTQTRTLIEIQENKEEKRKTNFPPGYLLPIALALLLLTITGAVAFRGYQNGQAKTSAAEINSIAVLPLKPIAASEADKVLSLGLADALITRLGASQKIVVRPVSSISQYVETEFDALAVGRELQTDAVLEGTFQRLENRLRVTARLLRVADGKQIWAGTFSEIESDLFRLQDSISKEAAQALSLNFNPSDRDSILKRYTENVAAYQAYQRGRYLYFRREEEKDSLQKSFAEFEEAVRLDAGYALAYSGLADAHARVANNAPDAETRRMHYEKAKELARKAILLDPLLAEAYASLGWINRIYDWNWAESEANFKKAIELAPNVWTNYRLYAYLLITLGRTSEAVEMNRRAKQLNPLQADGWILYCNRQFEESSAESIKQMAISNSADVRHDLALAYLQLGKTEQSIEILEQLTSNATDSFKVQSALAIAYFRAGQREKAENLLRELEGKAGGMVGRFARLANVYSEMGRTGQAIEALQKGFDGRDDRMMWIKTSPHLDALRGDPRFEEILRKMNLD